MKVIVNIKWDKYLTKMISVRKCPPDYKLIDVNYEEEFIIELEDYTDEDIRNYLKTTNQIHTLMEDARKHLKDKQDTTDMSLVSVK